MMEPIYSSIIIKLKFILFSAKELMDLLGLYLTSTSLLDKDIHIHLLSLSLIKLSQTLKCGQTAF